MIEHIAAEDLAAFADGALKGEARSAAEAHLSRCRECRQALAEVVEIQTGRDRIPPEFLQKALQVPAEAPEGPRAGRVLQPPGSRPISLRPAFGIAAVFLVAVVVVGFFFLGRGRMVKRASAVAEEPLQDIGAAGPQEAAPAAAPSERSLDERELEAPAMPAKADAAGALKKTAGRAAAEVQAGPSASGLSRGKGEPAAAPVEEARAAEAELALAEEDRLREQKDEGIAGGVVAGGDAAAVRDKAMEAKPAAPAAVRLSGDEKLKQEKEEPLRLKASSQAGWNVQNQRQQARHGPNAGEASAAASQILLAVNGQAAAPLMMGTELQRSPLGIDGDVAIEDLLLPQTAGEWPALPDGLALELEIAADGTVAGVSFLGEWPPGAAAQAAAAARRMVFSASKRKTRRAVLRAPGS